jgi:hypothetical protein
MKVLMIFIDMIKGSDFTKNKSKASISSFNMFLNELGGTIFSKTFTEGPDTPRSMSSFYSGLSPSKNGCIDRLRWPRYFLNTENTIFDYFIENNYKLNFFSNPNERANGLFPEKISKMGDIHNTSFDLKNFVENTIIADNQLLFISLPDLHFSMDDIGYNTLGEYYGYYNVLKSLKIIFNKFDKNIFDNILIFSDHGYKYKSQLLFQSRNYLLNKDRTQTFLFSRNKFDKNLKYCNNLLALSDVFHVYNKLTLDCKVDLTKKLMFVERESVLIEDHIKFNNEYGQIIGVWAFVNNNSYYIRTQSTAFLIDLKSKKVLEGISKKFDLELMALKSFSDFFNDTIKLNQYESNILTKTVSYSNGFKRIKIPI